MITPFKNKNKRAAYWRLPDYGMIDLYNLTLVGISALRKEVLPMEPSTILIMLAFGMFILALLTYIEKRK
jgi:hypothetical protein